MSRKKEILKYVFIVCIGLLLEILVCTMYLKVRSLQPTTYKFSCVVNTEDNAFVTTDYISVPYYMCEAGKTEVNNSTGYDIILFTRETEFQIVGQENFTEEITPVSLFVIEPESGKSVSASGDFTIKNEKGEEITYHIKGDDESITVSCNKSFLKELMTGYWIYELFAVRADCKIFSKLA